MSFLIFFSSSLKIFLISFVELFNKPKNINKEYPIKVDINITVILFVKANTTIFFEESYFSEILSSTKKIAFKAKSHPNINFKRDKRMGNGSIGDL